MSNFPGLGRYAALGSIMAARANNVAAQTQNQMGQDYIQPQVSSQFMPVKGPENALEVGVNGTGPVREIKALDQAPMEAGQAPETPQQGDITLPPMPASSMIRDVAPKTSMAGFIANNNRKYRGLA